MVVQEDDHHHWLIHHDMENMKDHDAYQDRRKKQENTMDMDQQRIKFHVQLAEKKPNHRIIYILQIKLKTYRRIHRFRMSMFSSKNSHCLCYKLIIIDLIYFNNPCYLNKINIISMIGLIDWLKNIS